MAFRLIFTSSPSSLTGSRTGFCTVARSAEMSEKLALFVEKCGTYDHEKMGAHPVFSHRIIWLGDKSYHILSRIIDSGTDYTNRSNYIADHLVLTDDETALLPSPAQAILDFDGWLGSYTDAPRFLGNVEIKKAAQKFAPPASLWGEIFADAGKAALMLSDNVEIRARASDGETLLKMFAQASALCTPSEKAWQYTFTTALCRGENPQDFCWKTFVGENSAPENSAAINLIEKTSLPAPENAAAEYARTANISNRDRLNLKVQRPSDFKPKFKIARQAPEVRREIPQEFKRNMIIVFAAAAAVAAACAIFALMPAKSGGEFEENMQIQKRAYASQTPLSGARPLRDTYSKVRADVKDLVSQARWQEALDLWDGANLQDFNPKARPEILSDMGKKFDAMLVEAEGEIKNSNKAKAAELLKKAEPALQIKDFPHKANRAQMMEGLNSKIKQL
ncbi:MAG: hypothetical protein IKO42_05900 [Opitutales bacterium]|nr:hypothetical protein [Opitutales bacterium]